MKTAKDIATKTQRRKEALRNLTFNSVQHSFKLYVLVPSWQKNYSWEF